MTESRWSSLGRAPAGAGYAQRFADLAASGADVHGEARFCARLVSSGSTVLDAGCGTGRVAIRLSELGYRCVGVDADPSMLEQARLAAPALTWVEADLAAMDPYPELAGPFELIVAAGNVLPLLAPGTEPTVIEALAQRLDGGLLVCGFGLDRAHLPLGAPPFGLTEYDGWCAAAGLDLVARYATWDADPYEGGGYAVSVHRSLG